MRSAGHRHRLNHTPNAAQHRDDEHAEAELHGGVYFLALAVHRVVRFHDLLAEHLDDPRLSDARADFRREAPHAKELRDFLEHMDAYLLDHPAKHIRFPGRSSAVLELRWDADNVVVCFGPHRVDVTLAAVAASKLGQRSFAVWEEHIDRWRETERLSRTNRDDPEMIEVELGLSTVIKGGPTDPVIQTGILCDVRLT